MVKKLLKHEFIYYFRTFGLFLPIVLVVGIATRITRFFEESNNVISQLAIISSSAVLIVSCLALLILAFVISIVRFYKNLYSSEGYLTFALPVTNAEHIFVKLFAAMVWELVCLLTVAVTGLIALSGEELVEGFNAFVLFTEETLLPMFGAANIIAIAFLVEMLLLVLIAAASNKLLYYACITVGQTAKKNRILMAIGAYFVYYVAAQIIGTVFTGVITVLGMTGALDSITEWMEVNFIAGMHIYLCVSIVFGAAVSALFWMVTQTIMTKKLNLE